MDEKSEPRDDLVINQPTQQMHMPMHGDKDLYMNIEKSVRKDNLVNMLVFQKTLFGGYFSYLTIAIVYHSEMKQLLVYV